jgi:hypothetical protein
MEVPLAPVDAASGLAGQPLPAGSTPAVALATAALLHYLGVNPGGGSRAPSAAEGALHVARDVCAQWLQTYAGLHLAAPGSVTMHAIATADPTDAADAAALAPLATARELGDAVRAAQEAGTDPGALQPGQVPAPAALLGWLADWVGSVLPACAPLQGVRGVFDDEVAPLLPAASCLRPRGEVLAQAQARGAGLTGQELARALSAVLDTALLWCEVPQGTPTVPVPRQCPFRGGSGFPVPPTALAAAAAAAAAVDRELAQVPVAVTVRLPGVPPDHIMAALLRGAVMAVAHGPNPGTFTVLVSNSSDEAVLLKSVAVSAAMTMVQAVLHQGAVGTGAGTGAGAAVTEQGHRSPGCERGLVAALVGLLPHAGVDVAYRALADAFAALA